MNGETKNHRNGIAINTQKFDLFRNTFNGIVEASFASTCLLVAIRYFEASDTVKSLLAGGGSIGFLITPLFLLFNWKKQAACKHSLFNPYVLCCYWYPISAAATTSWFYAGSVLIACVLAVQVPSLMVHIYSNNYNSNERGRVRMGKKYLVI